MTSRPASLGCSLASECRAFGLRGLLVAACLAACGGDGDGATSPGAAGGNASPEPPGGEPGKPEAPPNRPRTLTIEIRGIAFNVPGGGDFVRIGLGERVRWVNLDGTIHTATSVRAPVGAKPFHSGPMKEGDEFTFTPRMAGTWEYTCLEYPDQMSGARIVVTE